MILHWLLHRNSFTSSMYSYSLQQVLKSSSQRWPGLRVISGLGSLWVSLLQLVYSEKYVGFRLDSDICINHVTLVLVAEMLLIKSLGRYRFNKQKFESVWQLLHIFSCHIYSNAQLWTFYEFPSSDCGKYSHDERYYNLLWPVNSRMVETISFFARTNNAVVNSIPSTDQCAAIWN